MKRGLYGFLTAVCLVLALTTGVWAANENIVQYPVADGFIQFDKDTGTVMAGSATDLVIPSVIDNVNVTTIGWAAFQDNTRLRSVTIPSSVTSIDASAFYDCSRMTSIEVETDNPSYSSIDGVLFNKDATDLLKCLGGKTGEYLIPNSVTSIYGYAFDFCNSLTSVTIPNSVTSISIGAFDYCNSLTEIKVEADNPSYSSIDGVLFNKDATSLHTCPGGKAGVYLIPDGVTSIEDQAFRNCRDLTSVTIPSSATSIGRMAFDGCTGLTNVTISNGVTRIKEEAFVVCSSLTNVVIPNSVTSIEYRAFAGCSSLTSVTISNSLTFLGLEGFGFCDNLTDVYYDGTREEYEQWRIDILSGNDKFLNATFHFKESPSPNPSPAPSPSPAPNPNPGSTPGGFPNTADEDNTTLYGSIFFILSALTVTVWALGRKKRKDEFN